MTSKLVFDLGGLAVLIVALLYSIRRASKIERNRGPLIDESVKLQRESQVTRLKSIDLQQETLAELRQANKLLAEIVAAARSK